MPTKIPEWKLHEGEVIELWWEDGPYTYYINGHVDIPTALAKVNREYGAGVSAGDYKYARWSVDSRSTCDTTLAIYDEPGPGRFPVTECE